MINAMKRPVSPAGDAEEESVDRKAIRKASSWQTFSSSDPLYALMGEVQEKKVVSDDGKVHQEDLNRYLQVLVLEQAAQKPKDWVDVWAKMNIPVDSQSKVLSEIIAFCLHNAPPVGGLGSVLAELIKNHRVKTKAVEDAVEFAMARGQDTGGVLRQMLFSIYPKGPDSNWGWSRVGWSWQEWWKICERTIGCLDDLAAFDEMGLLLERLESESGKPLTQQSAWSEARLAKVRDSLCKFANMSEAADLQACVAASLTSKTPQ